MFLSTLIGAAAQITTKNLALIPGDEKFYKNIEFISILFLALILLLISFILYYSALRYDELTKVAPWLSLTYVWLIILSPFFSTIGSIGFLDIIGSCLIVMGIVLIGKG